MEKKPPRQKISIQFDQDVLEAVRRLAREDARSFNGEVLWILRAYVAARGTGETRGRDGHA